MKHPVKSRMFLFYKLPSAFFSGVRVREVELTHCKVSVPYKWFSQNPFRSTYFACLAMAAEMSTGVLAMTHVYNKDPGGSMLVISLNSEYFKKAKGMTIFTCNQGKDFEEAVNLAYTTGEPVSLRAESIGTNEKGEQVAKFIITWSFKFNSKITDPIKSTL
ncbi:MAG: DUF4442 domain-containing protein [Flavitalea sp.]